MTSQNPRDMRDYMRTLERLSVAQRSVPDLINKVKEEIKEEEKETAARRPAPPIELSPQSAFYFDEVLRKERVLFLLDFPDVIFNTDGSKADIQQYELWGQPVVAEGAEEPIWELQATSTESAFRNDRYIPNSQWKFRARALGMDAVLPGEWSEEITVRMIKDTVPPPQPTAPVVTINRGVLTVTWNGKAVTGDMPQDFEYAILAHDIIQTPTREVARFTAEGGFKVIADLKYRVMQYFRIRAVDQSGNLGPWSAVASGFTTPLVDEDVILSEIDAAKTVIKNANKVILESGAELGKKLQEADAALEATEKKLTGPGGLTERLVDAEALLDDAGSLVLETGKTLRQKLQDSDTKIEAAEKKLTGPGGLTERLAGVDNLLKDVGSLTYATGQTLRQKLAASDTALSTAQGHITTLRETTLPKLNSDLSAATKRLTAAEQEITDAAGDLSVAQGEITKVANRVSPLETGVNTLKNVTIPGLQTSIDGKTGIIRRTAAPTVSDLADPGTRWEVWTSLGVGGKLTGTWRRAQNGASWIEDVLSASYLPLVDIGAGTFGTLAGGRLEVNSVTADKVLIGVGGNLYPDPDMLDVAGYGAGSLIGHGAVGTGKTGRGSLLISANDGQVGSYYGLSLANRRIPIVAGGQYLISAWVRGSGVPKGGAALFARFYKADNTFIWGTPSTVANDAALLANTWTEVKGTFTAPEDAISLVVGFYSQTANPNAVRFSDPSVRQASGGELIVNGSITGTHIDAESVAAQVGTFVKINVQNITATATANLNSVVAQRIAAGTASFQRVDAKNLFVTGTSSLDTVVAERLAAETGTFIQLNVDQLDVTGNANLKTAVADKLFANIFATNKLTTNELLVGKGENLIPWLVNAPVGSRTVDPHIATNGASALSLDGGTTGLIGGHALTNNQNVTPGTYASTIQLRPATKSPNLPTGVFEVLPNTKYKISVWVKAGGSYGTYPNIRLNIGIYNAEGAYTNGPWYSVPKVISWSWDEHVYEFTTPATASGVAIYVQMNQPGVMRIDQPSLVKDGASLIATGGIVADHITASKEMSAKIGTFLELNVNQLTATGNSNLNEVVANKMFSNIFATNRLTANQILIGEGGNLLADPNFIDPDGWSGSNYITKNAGRNGNNGMVMPAGSSSQQGTYYGSTDRNRQFAVVPGASYKLSAWVKPDAAVPIGGIAIYMKWTTPSSAAAGSFATPDRISNKEALKAGVWTEVTGTVAVSDTAVKGFIGLFSQGTTTTRVIFSEPSVVQAVDQGLIVDNGILARHITASEEMSAKIGTFLELNVNQLTATGTSTLKEAVIENLWSNVVRSRSITTDMLLVGKGANLIPNGDLANGKDGWSSGFGIYVGDPSSKAVGFPAALWYLGNGTGNSPSFALKGGTKYRFSMYARGSTTGKRFYVQLITDNANAASPYLVQNQLTYTSLRQYEADVEVEAGVTSAYLRIFANHANGDTTEGHQWFSGFELHEMNAASLIVAGGIVAKQLKITEEMTAALLKAKKVEAIEIDVNSLSADAAWIGVLRGGILINDVVDTKHIMADAIDAKHRITGALVRTAATGARTEMTNQGIRVLNAQNIELVRLGYGIGTGMSIRNPVNGVMAPLSNMVFGAEYFTSTVPIDYEANTTSQVRAPDMVAYGFKYLPRTASASFEYTAVSESALLMWEAIVDIWNTNTRYPVASTEYLPFELGMNIFNVSGTGTPGEIADVGNFGRYVTGWTKTRVGSPGGSSAFDGSVQGMGVVTGMTPGSKYKVPVFLQAPNYQSGAAAAGHLNVRVRNVRLVIIPR